jgi:hypothetical protein
MEKGSFAVLLVASLVGSVVVVACGETEEPSTFGDPSGNTDSGPPPGNFAPDGGTPEAGDAAPFECEVNIPETFEHTWKPPTHQDACTTEQLGSYYDECLESSALNEPAKCEAWRKVAANAGCLACVETADNSGPVQWFDAPQRHYFWNFAGCFALEDDPGDDKCGALHDKVAQCTRASCSSCLEPGGSFFEFTECQKDARTQGICASIDTQRQSACQGVTGADGTAKACRGGNDRDHWVNIGTIFCGPTE